MGIWPENGQKTRKYTQNIRIIYFIFHYYYYYYKNDHHHHHNGQNSLVMINDGSIKNKKKKKIVITVKIVIIVEIAIQIQYLQITSFVFVDGYEYVWWCVFIPFHSIQFIHSNVHHHQRSMPVIRQSSTTQIKIITTNCGFF